MAMYVYNMYYDFQELWHHSEVVTRPAEVTKPHQEMPLPPYKPQLIVLHFVLLVKVAIFSS